MSPEQILGRDVTGAADVVSLGAVLAFAATGEPPFRGDTSAALLYQVVHEEPDLGTLTGDLRGLAADCLAKDPSARPAPADIARRLAPGGGAARLVAGGWLPGPLVEQVSRSAVHLLNLDPTGEPASGPIGFSSPSVGGVPDEAAADADAEAGSGSGSGQSYEPARPADGGTGRAGEPARAGGRGPGRLSLTVAATASEEGPGRVRKLSCTVALAVAGALAAVTIGSVAVFDLLPSGTDDAGGSDDAGPAVSAPAGAPTDRVPAAYVGTWEGRATARDGDLPLGTFRLTVRQARPGQRLGTLRRTDNAGGTCDDVLTLERVSARQLVADAVGAAGNRSVCAQARHTVRLTPVGDDVRYESDSEDSGRPRARMSRIR